MDVEHLKGLATSKLECVSAVILDNSDEFRCWLRLRVCEDAGSI